MTVLEVLMWIGLGLTVGRALFWVGRKRPRWQQVQMLLARRTHYPAFEDTLELRKPSPELDGVYAAILRPRLLLRCDGQAWNVIGPLGDFTEGTGLHVRWLAPMAAGAGDSLWAGFVRKIRRVPEPVRRTGPADPRPALTIYEPRLFSRSSEP